MLSDEYAFSEGAFFSITGYECGSEHRTNSPIVKVTPAVSDTELKNLNISSNAETTCWLFPGSVFCLMKRKRSYWLFNDNTIHGSPLAVSPHPPGWERESNPVISWLGTLSPRERWVESQPRGTFPMLKVLRAWEHCFPGNDTFTHNALFRCETAVNCEVYISHTEEVYALHYSAISQPNINDSPPSFSVLKGTEDFLLEIVFSG